MRPNPRQLVANVALFYLGWFACVVGAARGAGLAGPALAAVIIAVHVGCSDARLRSLQLVLASVVLGALVDGVLGVTGLVRYAAADLPAPLPPSWILGLWGLFATTLDVALRWLDTRPRLAVALGFVSGPLSYVAGEGLGALELSGRVDHLVLIGVVWAAALLVITRLSDRAHRTSGASAILGEKA